MDGGCNNTAARQKRGKCSLNCKKGLFPYEVVPWQTNALARLPSQPISHIHHPALSVPSFPFKKRQQRHSIPSHGHPHESGRYTSHSPWPVPKSKNSQISNTPPDQPKQDKSPSIRPSRPVLSINSVLGSRLFDVTSL